MFKKEMGKLDVFDVGLIKLSVVAFVLFVLGIWPAAMDWIGSVNPWYFFVVFLLSILRPGYRFWIK